MTATMDSAPPKAAFQGLWRRKLDHYPNTRPRMVYLAIVVLATIVLYYQYYVPGAVSPSIIAHFGMTFPYYVYIVVAGNAVGAFGSLVAGLADRWGRANLVAYGLVIVGLLVTFALPNAGSKLTYGICFSLVAIVEGVILVATPALVRDFSPQLGRATAMGFWTLGPVIGSLVLAEVSSHTLTHLHAWQDQFVIAGIAGLTVGVIAVFGLRELSPALRDQLMVSVRDRALIEARARGIDVEDSPRRPRRQMLHWDIVGSAFAIALFLVIYYTAVGFFTVYFTSQFGFSLAKADGIGDWFWAFDAGALIVVGIVSDLVKVRKPFMVLGAVGAIVMTIIFASFAGHPHTSYYTFAGVISGLAVFLGIAYAPWMASFTETAERRNPALVATALAIWGWIIRAVIALSVLILPSVVGSMTPLVSYGPSVAAISAKYAPQVATLKAISPSTLAALTANPANAAAAAAAAGEIVTAEGVSPAAATAKLTALATVPKADLAYLNAHGTQVATAAATAPGQWKDWWWVCVGGEVLFIPLIFLMAGRWDPRRARRDAEEHERRVRQELEALRA